MHLPSNNKIIRNRTVIELKLLGLTKKEIAKRVGIHRQTVKNILDKYGTVAQLDEAADLKSAEVIDPLVGSNPTSPITKAYSYIFGIYLGDGCINKQPRCYKLRIAQDSKYKEVIKEIQQNLELLFPYNKIGIYKRKTNSVDICVHNNDYLLSLFPQHSIGKKYLREIKLTDWQKEILDKHPESFIKGLIHSDGCFYITTQYNKTYERYGFANKSIDILNLIRKYLEKINIKYNYHLNKTTKIYRLSIARKEEVQKLKELIGTKK
jgi:hypothetical protein